MRFPLPWILKIKTLALGVYLYFFSFVYLDLFRSVVIRVVFFEIDLSSNLYHMYLLVSDFVRTGRQKISISLSSFFWSWPVMDQIYFKGFPRR